MAGPSPAWNRTRCARCCETQSHRHCRRETCRPCLDRLTQALERYRGDLLAGFLLQDCPTFDDWLTIERERLHVQALESLALLADAAERRGDYPTAQACIRRQLALEPWQEEAYRRRMCLLALEGRRAAAIACPCPAGWLTSWGISPKPKPCAIRPTPCANRRSTRLGRAIRPLRAGAGQTGAGGLCDGVGCWADREGRGIKIGAGILSTPRPQAMAAPINAPRMADRFYGR